MKENNKKENNERLILTFVSLFFIHQLCSVPPRSLGQLVRGPMNELTQ